MLSLCFLYFKSSSFSLPVKWSCFLGPVFPFAGSELITLFLLFSDYPKHLTGIITNVFLTVSNLPLYLSPTYLRSALIALCTPFLHLLCCWNVSIIKNIKEILVLLLSNYFHGQYLFLPAALWSGSGNRSCHLIVCVHIGLPPSCWPGSDQVYLWKLDCGVRHFHSRGCINNTSTYLVSCFSSILLYFYREFHAGIMQY